MNICNHPLSLFDLSPDILNTIIDQVKRIKLHSELKKRWALYGSVCSFSKPSNRCNCELICSCAGRFVRFGRDFFSPAFVALLIF